jgi:hypothetical protein
MQSDIRAILTRPLIRPPNFDQAFVQTNADQAVNDEALFEVIQAQQLEEP